MLDGAFFGLNNLACRVVAHSGHPVARLLLFLYPRSSLQRPSTQKYRILDLAEVEAIDQK